MAATPKPVRSNMSEAKKKSYKTKVVYENKDPNMIARQSSFEKKLNNEGERKKIAKSTSIQKDINIRPFGISEKKHKKKLYEKMTTRKK